jgi:hypothetical protein
MLQPHRTFRFAAFVTALVVVALPSTSHAGTWVAFQNSYTRGTGSPVTVTNTFTLLNPATQYTLKAFNGGLQNDTSELVSSSVVYLNGTQVVGPANFNQSVAEVNVTISPGPTNTLSVQVRGKPGGVLTIQVIGVDNDPPTITASVSPSPNASGWNNSPVTITFTCSDKTSGVASCPSPITINTEGANQIFSGTATDLAGNTASASVTVNLDMTPPTVTGSINPPPDAGGYNSSAVTVNFTCADALSGVASCSPAVSVTTEGTTQVPGTATDVAGNTASITITVNISFNYFKIQSWQTGPNGNAASPSGKCLDYGTSPSGNGATVFLNDCTNANAIRVVEVGDNTDSQGNVYRLGSRGIHLAHEVMLFAGRSVIGIHNPQTITLGGTAPSSPFPTEYSLELQVPWNSPHGVALSNPANQIFRLDGDSIILEGTSVDPMTGLVVPGPCVNTIATLPPLCADAPPQLVIQVQNARGANGSPLVAAVRNLSDNELWDFNAVDGSGKFPTGGFVAAASSAGLWNALCQSPAVTTPFAYLPASFPVIHDPGQSDDGLPLNFMCPAGVGWGTVVVITDDDPNECAYRSDVGPCLDFSDYPPLQVPAGVTVRGKRRGTNFGAQLFAQYTGTRGFDCDGNCILEVQGDYARVTGLRVRGQSRSTDKLPFKTYGVWINFAGSGMAPGGMPPQIPLFPLATVTELIAIVDHNDMSDWMDSAVTAFAPFTDSAQKSNKCTYIGYLDSSASPQNYYTCDQNTQTTPYSPYLVSLDPNLNPVPLSEDGGTLANIRVSRNFLHHNEANEGGYGVAMGNSGGRLLIEGNTFSWNRHDITASGEPHSEYRATRNLVLSRAYESYGFAGINGRLQDFDVHGTDNVDNLIGSLYFGGAGGYHAVIDGNTFLGPDGHDYVLRGYPFFASNYFHNVSRRKENDAIHFIHCADLLGCINDYTASDFPISISSDNRFADSSPPYTDPTIRLGPAASLGVGDFDGDGDDDLFLATGVAWYYAPAGAREWRFLNAAPDTIDQLLLGDFDGDGRTDVIAMRNGQLVVSWGGISAFEVLNANTLPCTSMSDMAVGDFDGDGHADIFCADGGTWWMSYGGNTPFVQVIVASNLHVKDLRFGDFDGNGTTDVFGVTTGPCTTPCWMVRYGPKGYQGALGGWQPLPVSLTNVVDGLIVADFDGNGFADVLGPSSDGWQISYGGTQPWVDVPQGSLALAAIAGVGHFRGQPQADVLIWNGIPYLPFSSDVTALLLSSAAVSPPTQYSTQDMR